MCDEALILCHRFHGFSLIFLFQSVREAFVKFVAEVLGVPVNYGRTICFRYEALSLKGGDGCLEVGVHFEEGREAHHIQHA
jgi:hypothetical protein